MNISLEERFLKYIEKTPDCWLWIGAKKAHGYGKLYYNKKYWGAHQISWYLAHGYFSKKLVCHNCDNTSCVNPQHLFEGSHKENTQDSIKKGRFKFNLKKGQASLFKANKNRKITFEIAEEIREKYKKGEYKYKEIKERYPISDYAIYQILHHITYKR